MRRYILALLLPAGLGLATCAHKERSGSAGEVAGVMGAVLITGKVSLPPVHPMMLFPRRVRGLDHIDGGMNQDLDEEYCNYLDKKQPRLTYGLRDQEQLKLSELLHLRVVPRKGGGSVQATEGVVQDDGSFSLEVPRSLNGYVLTAEGGKIALKARILPTQYSMGRVEDLRVDLVSTALTQLAEQSDAQTQEEPDEQLRQALGPRVGQVADQLHDLFTYGLWLANFGASSTTKAYYTFNACTSKNPDPTCYHPGDDVPYALMSAAELPSDATRWTPSRQTQALADQYAAQGLRFAVYRPAGATGSNADPPVEEEAGGFILVRPQDASGGGVDLVFESGVRAFGLTLQNGDTHADTSGAFPRRPFRFIPMDQDGAPIEEYHWYTNQGSGGAGFYGFASKTPVYRVRIEVRTPGPFTVGDLRWSETYPQAVADNLGWTATGNWKREQDEPENLAFVHPYYQGYEEVFGEQFFNLREQANDASKGHYWHVGYGPTDDPQGSTLMSPAFTLNNLDLDSDDDQPGFSWWISGVTYQTQEVAASMMGADKKVYSFNTSGNPNCRIAGVDFLFDETPFPKPKLMPGCTDKAWEGHYVAGMDTHWGHFHFRADIDVPEAAQWSNIESGPDRTERYVEYSTDNGATWRRVWWWPDQSHHGINDVWWKNHGHGFYDSDMVGVDWNGNGARGTDFSKDGVDDYIAPEDNNGNGIVDADPHGDDAREWDTEWYMEYIPPSAWKDLDGDGYKDPDIEGVTVRYRLRFVGPAKPAKCGTGDCFGWKMDDFAINNDNPRVGYFTTFDGSYDANLR